MFIYALKNYLIMSKINNKINKEIKIKTSSPICGKLRKIINTSGISEITDVLEKRQTLKGIKAMTWFQGYKIHVQLN